jgi:hypothetical protein
MRLSNALFVTAGLALLIVAAPALSALLAGVISALSGCVVSGGQMQSCIVLGREIGPLLFNMFMAFWLFIFTLFYVPIAFALAMAGFVARRREKRNPDADHRVSAVFWLGAIGALNFPLSYLQGLVLMTASAGLAAWRHFAARRRGGNA